jgi:sulfur carrier protein
MKIIINGEKTEVNATTLDQLLVELGYGDSRVATAVNGVFVEQGYRADCTLNEADRLEVVTPRQGG